MAEKTDALLIYSTDVWNGERGENGDLRGARVQSADAFARAEDTEGWMHIGVLHEIGTEDDHGFTPTNISAMDYPGFGAVWLVEGRWNKTWSRDNGEEVYTAGEDDDILYPQGAAEFPVTHAFPLDGSVEYMVRETKFYESEDIGTIHADVKEFIEARVEGDSAAEEMASEYSVDRVNPTVVEGAEDVRAETFDAEDDGDDEEQQVIELEPYDELEAEDWDEDLDEFEADVMPTGDGHVIGSATTETDFSPLGQRADVIPEGDGRVIGAHTATMDYEPTGARAECLGCGCIPCECVAYGADVLPTGDGRIHGARTADMDYHPLGQRAESNPFSKRGRSHFRSDVMPTGDGRVLGQHTATLDTDPTGQRADSFEAPHGRQRRNGRYLSRRIDGTFRKNVDVGRSLSQDRRSRAVNSARPGFGDQGDIRRSDVLPNGEGRVIGSHTATTDFSPMGARAETFGGSGLLAGAVGGALAAAAAILWLRSRGE